MKCAGYEVDSNGVLIGHPDFIKRLITIRTQARTQEVERRSLTLHYYNGDERAILDKAVLVIIRRKALQVKAGRDSYAEDQSVMARIEKAMLSGE